MPDFGQFDLIIDARSQREYADDHIPGARNLPVVNDQEYAEVGTLHRSDPHRAYIVGVAYALSNISRHIDTVVGGLPFGSRIAVYCFRGGKRSKLWSDALETIGYRVERIEGGWKAYRRWAREQLERLPPMIAFHVLCGPTGCGKTRLLKALQERGGQVLDLEELAGHRGSLIGAVPGVVQPKQKLFESLVLDRLRRFDPERPVWVEAESKNIGSVQVPDVLFAAMHGGRCFPIEAPMPERVRLWREDYSHFEADPEGLMSRLHFLRPLIGGEEFSRWESLAQRRRMPELFERLMTSHYDPAYRRSSERHYPQIAARAPIRVHSLHPSALAEIAAELLG